MQNTLKKIFNRMVVWCFRGGVAGAIIGALGGLFDRGSLFILVPSGPLFWALFGAFCGCILGAVVGPFTLLGSHRKTSREPTAIEETGGHVQQDN